MRLIIFIVMYLYWLQNGISYRYLSQTVLGIGKREV